MHNDLTAGVNGMGKKLVNFDFTKTPLSAFNNCPRRILPDVRGCIVEITAKNNYKLKIGEDAFIDISEGGGEVARNIGDVVWLQYNSWKRHPFWSAKHIDYKDDKYFPVANV